MKKLQPSFWLVICLLISLPSMGQNLTFSPKHPNPGQEVTLTYSPEGTDLQGMNDIEAVAYFLEGEMPIAKEVVLSQQGDKLVGTIQSDPSSLAMFVSFKHEASEKSDNNKGKGYKLKFYQEGAEMPVAGAMTSLAQAYASFQGRVMGLDQDLEKAKKYVMKEVKANPEAATSKDNLTLMATFAARNEDAEARTQVMAFIEKAQANKKATEEDLMLAQQLCRTLKEQDQMESLAELIRKKYPKGKFIKQEKMMAFYRERNPEEKEKLFAEWKKKYGSTEEGAKSLANMAGSLAGAFSQTDTEKTHQYLAMVNDNRSKASMLNNMAWNMVGGGLKGEAKDLEQAKNFSKESLQLVKASMDSPEGKPTYYTDKAWTKSMKGTYGMYADTYALILHKMGETEEAYKYQKKAMESRNDDPEMNERYAIYMEKAKGAEKTLAFLEENIRGNKSTAAMKKQFQRLFMDTYTHEQAAQKYLASLEKDARKHYRKEIEKKLINKPAIDFTLKNLDGEEVSLSAFKGKVVVLDFWATWCGPCIASFPGMQKAADKFGKDGEVVFLFIDTWENVKDKEANASQFMEKKGYNFEVLMDNKDEVVAKYGVEGIPTKFVLGRDGNIRFKSVGYNGSADKLVDEMAIMIELAGKPAIPSGAVGMNK